MKDHSTKKTDLELDEDNDIEEFELEKGKKKHLTQKELIRQRRKESRRNQD